MKKRLLMMLLVLLMARVGFADVVVLRDGKSYTGSWTAGGLTKLSFTDSQGIQYSFPLTDIQTIVFSNAADHLSLHNGQNYSGQLASVTRISFQGDNGVSYVFPLKDVASLILTQPSMPSNSQTNGTQMAGNQTTDNQTSGSQTSGTMNAPGMGTTGGQNYPGSDGPGNDRQRQNSSRNGFQSGGVPSVVVPSGTQLSVRTNETIDSSTDKAGQLYDAQISQDVMDSTGAVIIPNGTPAKLQVTQETAQDSNGKPLLALDLASIKIGGRDYHVDTSSVDGNQNQPGVGMNKRTAIYGGGGTALGALLGAAFGGGRGAGIGALAGAGGGLLTEYLVHAHQVKVPVESVLTFQLQQTLVLHP